MSIQSLDLRCYKTIKDRPSNIAICQLDNVKCKHQKDDPYAVNLCLNCALIKFYELIEFVASMSIDIKEGKDWWKKKKKVKVR